MQERMNPWRCWQSEFILIFWDFQGRVSYPCPNWYISTNNLKHYIKKTESNIPKSKRKRLIEFVDHYYDSPKGQNADLNVLYDTYRQWFRVFPFDLSLFSHLKDHFDKQLPLINGEIEENKYLGIVKGRPHTKSTLIKSLIDLTNVILTQINTYTLYEKGLLTEPQKIQLELLLNSRKLKLQEGYVNNSQNEEQRYRKILKAWLKDEIEFVRALVPIVDSQAKEILPENQRIKTVFVTLNKYRLSDFLKNSGRNTEEVYKLLIAHSGRDFVPYAIALLYELNYLDYFFKHFSNSKGKGIKKLGEIFGVNERRIKGNINVLNPSSSEDPTQYTSHVHIEKIRKELEGL